MKTENPPPSPADLELWHRIETEPEGTFRMFRADRVGTEQRIHQHLANFDELSFRIAQATEAGCVIEVISLRLQVMDFWLRVFFDNRAPRDLKRDREFGRLLRQCFDLGLPESLYVPLIAFNKQRIDAVHGYVIGSTSYEILEPVSADADRLLRDLVIFTVSNSGVVVVNRDEVVASPGAMVIQIEAFCEEVDCGKRY